MNGIGDLLQKKEKLTADLEAEREAKRREDQLRAEIEQADREIKDLQKAEKQKAEAEARRREEFDLAYKAAITALVALDQALEKVRTTAKITDKIKIPYKLHAEVTAALTFVRTFDPAALGIETLSEDERRRIEEKAHAARVDAIQKDLKQKATLPGAAGHDAKKILEQMRSG